MFLRYNSNPSSPNGLWWNAVKIIISSEYNRYYTHIIFSLDFPSPQTIFSEKVLRYLTSVACDRSLNLVNLDEHISVRRDFLRHFNCDVTRSNDGLTGNLR